MREVVVKAAKSERRLYTDFGRAGINGQRAWRRLAVEGNSQYKDGDAFSSQNSAKVRSCQHQETFVEPLNRGEGGLERLGLGIGSGISRM